MTPEEQAAFNLLRAEVARLQSVVDALQAEVVWLRPQEHPRPNTQPELPRWHPPDFPGVRPEWQRPLDVPGVQPGWHITTTPNTGPITNMPTMTFIGPGLNTCTFGGAAEGPFTAQREQARRMAGRTDQMDETFRQQG